MKRRSEPTSYTQHLCPVVVVGAAAVAFAAALRAQDTVRVSADNEPVWGAHPRLVEELRIGLVDGPEEYVLGSVETLTVGPHGDIFVFDALAPIIRQYDSTGRFVRDIGRDGEGPGEYRDVRGMHVFADGRLAIWDFGLARLTLYDSNGTYVESHTHHVLGHPVGDVFFVVDTAGNYYLQLVDLTQLTEVLADPVRRSSSVIPSVFVKLLPTFVAADSIPVPVAEHVEPSLAVTTRDGWRRSFPDELLSTLSNRGYLVVGHNRSYVLSLLFRDGSVRQIQRAWTEVRLTGEERAQWEANTRWFERVGPRYGAGTPKFPKLPRTKPVFRSLEVDADGRIWVGRYVAAVKRDVPKNRPGDNGPPLEWRERSTFDVIRPDGMFLGTVVLPWNTIALYRRGMHIWAASFGEFGEPTVVRLRIDVDEG